MLNMLRLFYIARRRGKKKKKKKEKETEEKTSCRSRASREISCARDLKISNVTRNGTIKIVLTHGPHC